MRNEIEPKSLCYVSSYYDIGRYSWSSFKRTFDEYLDSFRPYITMFDNLEPKLQNKYHFILFCDKRFFNIMNSEIGKNKYFTIIPTDEDYFREHTVMWNRLKKEEEIINDKEFLKLVGDRSRFPEHSYPKYSLINHIKIELVNRAIDITNEKFDMYCWTDFGYFSHKNRIPKNPINTDRLDWDRITYTLINKIGKEDLSIGYTLKYAPEKIGGFFFAGPIHRLREYKELYIKVHKEFQDMFIVDDDQHLALQCYKKNPFIFNLVCLYGWHKALVYYQL